MKITKKSKDHLYFETGAPWFLPVIALIGLLAALVYSTQVTQVQVSKDSNGQAKATVTHRLMGIDRRFDEVKNLVRVERELVRNAPGTESRWEIWFSGENGRIPMSGKTYGNHQYTAAKYDAFLEQVTSLLNSNQPKSLSFRADNPYWHSLIVMVFFFIVFVVVHQKARGHMDFQNGTLYLRVRKFILTQKYVFSIDDVASFKSDAVSLKSGQILKLQSGRDMQQKVASSQAVEGLNKALVSWQHART